MSDARTGFTDLSTRAIGTGLMKNGACRSGPVAAGNRRHGTDGDSLAEASGGHLPARLPPEEMAKLKAQLDAMPRGDASQGRARRCMAAAAQSGHAGQKLAAFVCRKKWRARRGIKDEVMAVGLIDYFEIWNPDRSKT
jgi:hypothetical protein